MELGDSVALMTVHGDATGSLFEREAFRTPYKGVFFFGDGFPMALPWCE
jgi:hypothetical protein